MIKQKAANHHRKKSFFFSKMDVVFIRTWKGPAGYDESQRTNTFHHTKSCHVCLSFAAQHFYDLNCCFKIYWLFNVQKNVSVMMANLLKKFQLRNVRYFSRFRKEMTLSLKIVTECPCLKSALNQQCSLESEIAPWICTPHPILIEWYELFGILRGNELDYIDLLDFWSAG